MSEQTHQVRSALNRDERKQLLALACAADRAAWTHACRPLPPRGPAAQLATDLLNYLEPFTGLLPRRFGRWVRGAGVLASLGRQFGLFRG